MGSIDYLRTDETAEFTVYDGTGRKIDSMKCQRRDKKRYKQILEFLREKYGFEPSIDDKAIKEENIDWFG